MWMLPTLMTRWSLRYLTPTRTRDNCVAHKQPYQNHRDVYEGVPKYSCSAPECLNWSSRCRWQEFSFELGKLVIKTVYWTATVSSQTVQWTQDDLPIMKAWNGRTKDTSTWWIFLSCWVCHAKTIPHLDRIYTGLMKKIDQKGHGHVGTQRTRLLPFCYHIIWVMGHG